LRTKNNLNSIILLEKGPDWDYVLNLLLDPMKVDGHGPNSDLWSVSGHSGDAIACLTLRTTPWDEGESYLELSIRPSVHYDGYTMFNITNSILDGKTKFVFGDVMVKICDDVVKTALDDAFAMIESFGMEQLHPDQVVFLRY